MAIFAVTYTYGGTSEQLNEIRPIHREFFGRMLAEGTLLASGPLVDAAGALLVMKAESLEEVASMLDLDPFDIAGLISERAIVQWNPVFGPWSEK
jgi:uncharacterized protein YciI